MCPRTTESEIDSMSNVSARIQLNARTKSREKLSDRENNLLAGREDLHTNRLIRDFIRAIGDEERDSALHRVPHLAAERSVGQVDEDTAALFAQCIGECLCGGDV